jgi:hypothetical protein
MSNFFGSPELEEALLCLHHGGVIGVYQVICDVRAEEIKAFDPLHCSPINDNRGVLPYRRVLSMHP